MNKERLFRFDFNNEEHVRLMKEFEQANGLSNWMEKYKPSSDENKVEEILFLEESDKIIDTCLIEGEKDIKLGRIYYSPLKDKLKNRSLINIAVNYCLNTLGFETAIIPVSKDDEYLLEILKIKGYEYLELEGEEHIFLKDKIEEKKDEQRARQ